MSETAEKVRHTPGPWKIGDELEGDIFACGELLASAYPMKRDGLHESWRANARLIAAAPELLEALEALLDIVPFATDSMCASIHERARTAIRSAKGWL